MTLISVLSISENQAKIYVKKLLQEVSGSGITVEGNGWMTFQVGTLLQTYEERR